MRDTDRTSAPVAPSTGRLRPLGLHEVTITGGFWADRQRVNGTATLAHIESWQEKEGWIPNFDLAAAGTLPEGRRGREFSDSEVYKLLEAIAWEIGRTDDAALEATFRRLVARIGAAQESDGYLNTRFGRPGQEPRWSELEWGHELYCLGHLFQAAVARVRTRPDADDGLLAIATRAADLVCSAFGPDGIQSICGHPEVEVGLAELGRVTGDPRYIEQSRLFVERRGHGALADIEFGRDYYQDEVPVREATVLRGHAVRANYLSAGAVDVAVETADDDLLEALAAQWTTTVARRTYITGGQGSYHQTEGFGDDWVLPADRAYSETCAGIGSIMFSWRLLLAQGDPRYADLIERTLFNVVATSPSHEGTAFFYANTLHQREPGRPIPMDVVSPRASSAARAPWFEVTCCPPNVARTFSSLAGYVATADADGIQLHQFATSSVSTRLDDGRAIALDVETAYPRDGSVRVTIRETPPDAWRLSLRVPGWAGGARLTVRPAGGEPVESLAEPGAAVVDREFAVGDVIELELPMAPRFVTPHPHIDAVRGCVAVERGPEVLCLESVDLGSSMTEVDFSDLIVDTAAALRENDGRVWVRIADVAGGGSEDVALLPYHDWAERGPSAMRVWIPTA